MKQLNIHKNAFSWHRHDEMTNDSHVIDRVA